MVERVIRTLKQRFQKYFIENNTFKWTDVLQQFVDNYNRTPHRAHGFPPLDVNAENTRIVYKKMYPDLELKTNCKLNVGDRVRILLDKPLFVKGYKENWSEEIYKIKEIRQKAGICWYYLVDHENNNRKGIFYYYQLNVVAKNARKYARKKYDTESGSNK